MKSTLPLIASLAWALTAGAAQAADPMPGQWQRQSALSTDGQNWQTLPAARGCLSPEQARQSIEQTVQAMVSQAAQAGCTAIDLKAANGQARGRFECQQPGGKSTIDVQGSYSADRYHLTMVATNLADRNGSGVVVPKMYMKHDGRHVGACVG